MRRTTLTLFAVSFVFVIIVSVMLLENSFLSAQNKELSLQLANTQNRLDDINRKYEKLQDNFKAIQNNSEISPAIETRLGIKVMDGASERYPNYLWVTGEVINTGNLTLYNAKLRFLLYTTGGTDIKEYVLGSLTSNQVVEIRFTAYSSLGKITDWKIEPVATYRP